jgi:ribosomal protein L7/L12
MNNHRLARLVSAISALSLGDLDVFSDDQVAGLRAIREASSAKIEQDKRNLRYEIQQREREAEDKLNEERRQAGLRALTGGSLNEEEIAACRRGRKIEAIKLVRERTHCTLSDAKEFVEAQASTLGISWPSAAYSYNG